MLYLSDKDNTLLSTLPPNSYGYSGSMSFFTSSQSINAVMTEIAVYDRATNAKIQVTNEFYRTLKNNGFIGYWATNEIISGSGGDVFSTDVLELKTEDFLRSLGISSGEFRVTYKFYINILGNEFDDSKLLVKTISPLRQEVELDYLTDALALPYEMFTQNNFYKNSRQYSFTNVLNFGNDRVFLLLNSKNQNNPDGTKSLVAKLYEPLPDIIVEKDSCWISTLISDVFVDIVSIVAPEKNPLSGVSLLASPDFSIDIAANTSEYTSYMNFTQLTAEGGIPTLHQYSNAVSSSDLYGIELYIDYANKENYVHFGSAKRVLSNFYNKMSAFEYYNQQMLWSTSSLSHASTSSMYWKNKSDDILNNFTRYERFLYYGSGSLYTSSIDATTIYDATWPKVGSSYPYVLYSTSSWQAHDWYTASIAESTYYDEIVNPDYLYKLVPEYIQLDADSNADYLTFIDMIGEFFDNIWTYVKYYYKVQTRDEKLYDSAPLELMWNILRNTGLNVNNGSDLVNVAQYLFGIYGSPTSSADIQQSNNLITKEIWNRLLNNYVSIYKSRGTEKSIYTLLNCYGIPNNLLTIREFGGASQDTANAGREFIIEDFTHVINFEGNQQVEIPWTASKFGRVPDAIELKFRTANAGNRSDIFWITGSWHGFTANFRTSLTLYRKYPGSNLGKLYFNFIPDFTSFTASLTSSYIPFYNGDFYNILIKREVLTDTDTITNQTYSMYINRYDELLNKVTWEDTSHLYAPLPPYNQQWALNGTMYLGGDTGSTAKFSGSIDEVRLWSENISYDTFKWHSQYSVATNGNNVTSSLDTLLVRLPFNTAYNLSVTQSISNMAFDTSYAPVVSASGFTNAPSYPFNFSYYERTSTAKNDFLTPAMDNDNKIRIVNNYLSQSVLLDTARVTPLSVPSGSRYDNVILDESVNNFVTIAGEYVDDTYTLDRKSVV